MTPSYRLWDPSQVVLISFMIFFSMIMSDAGYAAVFGLITLVAWKRMQATRALKHLSRLFVLLTIGSLAWGILVGSYFGITPQHGSVLSRLQLVDLNNSQLMMQITILVGVIHILIANGTEAWRQRSSLRALAPVGWVSVIGGGCLLWLAMDRHNEPLYTGSMVLMITGGLLILLFSSKHHHLLHRLLDGVIALTRITNAFGDILSYLRLFALGLASASLALAFNDLAHQVIEAIPGFGVLVAMIILMIGHALNFLLAVVSGFVHGLRLNFIEFFNWSIDEEGYPFKAFSRKERSPWNR